MIIKRCKAPAGEFSPIRSHDLSSISRGALALEIQRTVVAVLDEQALHRTRQPLGGIRGAFDNFPLADSWPRQTALHECPQ